MASPVASANYRGIIGIPFRLDLVTEKISKIAQHKKKIGAFLAAAALVQYISKRRAKAAPKSQPAKGQASGAFNFFMLSSGRNEVPT